MASNDYRKSADAGVAHSLMTRPRRILGYQFGYSFVIWLIVFLSHKYYDSGFLAWSVLLPLVWADLANLRSPALRLIQFTTTSITFYLLFDGNFTGDPFVAWFDLAYAAVGGFFRDYGWYLLAAAAVATGAGHALARFGLLEIADLFSPAEPAQQPIRQVWGSLAAEPAVSKPSTPERYQESTSSASVVYLAVPYAEKELAKSAGARWNPDIKSWYIDSSVPKWKWAAWEKK